MSKQIKQKFPAKWVVRFDLNDHTDALKALREEQIDKEKAIEFVSKEVLTLRNTSNKEYKVTEEKAEARESVCNEAQNV